MPSSNQYPKPQERERPGMDPSVQVSDAEVDPLPDIHTLFCHYNSLYFADALGSCLLNWSSKRMTLCAGVCRYEIGGGCEIRLSEPLLKFRSSSDVKNTLLHEMIHAYLWITDKNKDHSEHGPSFQNLMNEINSSSVVDHQRPEGGYNVTIYHSFHDEVDNYRVHHWVCQLCGDLIKRAMNREPSPSDCILKAKDVELCGDSSCHWHVHKMVCGGYYQKIAEPPGYKNTRKGSKCKLNSDLEKSEVLNCTRKGAQKGSKGMSRSNDHAVCKSKTVDNFFAVRGEASKESGSASLSSQDLQNDFDLCDIHETNSIVSSHSAGRPKVYDDGRGTSSSDFHKNKFDEMGSEATWNYVVPVRKAEPQGNDMLRKKRKLVGCTEGSAFGSYTVIIKWNNWYANEEEEDVVVEPLRNKRTERRKKQKLLKNFAGVAPKVESVEDHCHMSSTSARISTVGSEDGAPMSPVSDEMHKSINLGEDKTEAHSKNPETCVSIGSLVDVSGDCRSKDMDRDADIVELSDG